MNTAVVEPRALRSRAIPLLILLLFLAPMVSAWVVYKYFPDAVRSLGTKNFGTLVSPVVPLKFAMLQGRDGKIDASYFRDKWTYVYLADGCDDACRSNLYLMRQARLAQGGEMTRVQRLLVVIPGFDEASLRQLADQFPDMKIATDSPAQSFAQQFRGPSAAGGPPMRVFLVDPLGQLMMFYDVGPNPLESGTGMRKDLEMLLRNSKVG